MQKTCKLDKVFAFLDAQVQKRDTQNAISETNLDPLIVAKKYNDEYIALICALFSYGNVRSIVNFLRSLDFSLLKQDFSAIEQGLQNHRYRFQSAKDIIALFHTLSILSKKEKLEDLFLQGYVQKNSILEGLHVSICALYDTNPYRSKGYEFLLSKPPTCTNKSTLKRWMMYLRWMVRKDCLDMGLWSKVQTKDLLMPLDTHTFHIGQKLGLIKRKSYDFKAVLELTENLKKSNSEDPLIYDFALYKIGQEKIVF
ncbi:MAG: TIGR02757 family protein [Sulfurospirillum sp.]|nr:TIGR02757 family protein [Sulfurospirillum sp.]